MAKVLDESSRKAIAAAVRYYRDLGIYDFYRRECPPEICSAASGEQATGPENAGPEIVRQELARADVPAAMACEAESAPQTLLPEVIHDKPAALCAIREHIGNCTRCRLCEARTNIVFGVGDPEARIFFVGEGPGADEDAQGEPFVGRAGQLLNNMIQAMGLSREQVYIGNVVKCRPPKNRVPEPDECATCGPFLLRQIAVVRPEMIVALGATAARFLLCANGSMASLRGCVHDFRPGSHPAATQNAQPPAPESGPSFATKLVVTYHPAYLLRDPRQKKEAWMDLQLAMQALGMPMPRRDPES